MFSKEQRLVSSEWQQCDVCYWARSSWHMPHTKQYTIGHNMYSKSVVRLTYLSYQSTSCPLYNYNNQRHTLTQQLFLHVQLKNASLRIECERRCRLDYHSSNLKEKTFHVKQRTSLQLDAYQVHTHDLLRWGEK